MPLFQPDSLGRPGEGFHTHVGGIAVLDVAATAVVGYLVAKKMDWNPALTIAGAFAVGQFAHWYWGVPTAMTRRLGLLSPSQPLNP